MKRTNRESRSDSANCWKSDTTCQKLERFYTAEVINGQNNGEEGPIKTFTLRGIKDSPPYLHDGRLLTLEDTVEFFNLVLQLRLSAEEKQSLVAYMKAL